MLFLRTCEIPIRKDFGVWEFETLNNEKTNGTEFESFELESLRRVDGGSWGVRGGKAGESGWEVGKVGGGKEVVRGGGG